MARIARSAPPGFSLPDLESPLDVDALIAKMPPDMRIRGMFLQGIVDRCSAAGHPLGGCGPYVAFKDYEVKEYVRLLAAAADALHPDLTRRRAFVMLGRSAYDTMVDTLIGKVVFGVLGRDIHRITRLVGKAYEVAGRGITAHLLDIGEGFSHVRIVGPIGMVENYHVGAFEGVLRSCGQEGEVKCKLDDTGGELFTNWWPSSG